MPEGLRNLVWLVDSLATLKCFPPSVRQKLGFALYQAQIGQRHGSAKMLHGFAETIRQVRADDPGGTYRAVYVATPHREVELIKQRLQLARKLAIKKGH